MDKKELFELIKSITAPYEINPNFAWAVATNESDNNGYDREGNIKVRFEPHVFKRYAKKLGFSSLVASDRFGRSAMLEACKINREYAYMSTSFGMYQIMGFNHKTAGYDDVFKMVDEFTYHIEEQIKGFCNFCKNENLIKFIKAKNFAQFAYYYNGPNYSINNYDKKLEKNYNNSFSIGQ